MGLESLLIAGLAFGAAGVGAAAIAKSGEGKGSASPIPQPLPAPPKIDAAADEAQKQALKRRGAATKTVFTDPLGVGGQADIVRKTLTGQ